MEAILILHDIRSAHNVGSLFRTADAVGISKIYMSKISPSPLDRFGRERSDIAKTALGAEKTIPWVQYESIEVVISALKEEGYVIVAIEQSSQAIDYKSIPHYEKIAFILGNEVGGISQEILVLVDTIVEIPMKGEKESLNVAVAGGVVLFRALDR
jgi:23S rRNA (guanosine2251-2'-O)-methyltransferase